MKYRFVRVTNNYPQYLKQFYQKHPQTYLQSFNEQHKELTEDSIEIASAYVKNFNELGVPSIEIISNATTLQDTWKKENNVSTNISSKELIIKQLKTYQPEIVWIDDLTLVDKDWKTKLLTEVPSIKLFVGHHCAPYNTELAEKLRLFDIMFTCIPCLKKEFDQLEIKSHLLYHGFEASILEKIKHQNSFPESNFLFTGSLYTGSGFHKERLDYVEAIIRAGIKADLYCNLEPFKKLFVKKVFYNLIVGLKKIGLSKIIEIIPFLRQNKAFGDTPINFYSKKLVKSSNPPVFGNEMYQLLSKSKISFNIHGEVAGNCAGNIRLFEATGVGTCLVTDWKDNITELFEPGKEIVTYKSIDECIEKIKWLIENPAEREKIAKAGQEKTLKNHTIKIRSEELIQIFNSYL